MNKIDFANPSKDEAEKILKSKKEEITPYLSDFEMSYEDAISIAFEALDEGETE